MNKFLLASLGGCLLLTIVNGQGQSRVDPSKDLSKFLGTWISTGQMENFDEFIRALGPDAPPFLRKRPDKVIIKLTKLDDERYKCEMIINPDSDNKRHEHIFKLGEDIRMSLDGVEVVKKHTLEDGKLKVEMRIPSKNKVVNSEFVISGDELIKTCKVDNVMVTGRFRKEAGEVDKHSELSKFAGTWVFTDRIENWDQFLRVIGSDLPGFPVKLDKVIMKLSKVDNERFKYEATINPDSDNVRLENIFKLGEESRLEKNGVVMFKKYVFEDGKLKAVLRIPSKNKIINEELSVSGDELIKIHKVDNVEVRARFVKDPSSERPSLSRSFDPSKDMSKFAGTWVFTDRIENWDQFLAIIGRDLPTYPVKLDKVIMKLTKVDNERFKCEITLNPDSANMRLEHIFKLGEEARLDKNGIIMFKKYVFEDGKLKAVLRIPSKNKIINEELTVSGDELIKIQKVDNVEIQARFRKDMSGARRSSLSRTESSDELPFLGTWVSTGREENWDAFIAALGPDVPTHFTKRHEKSIHKFEKVGADRYRHELLVLPRSLNFKKDVTFKLGEEETVMRDGVEYKFKYTKDNEGNLNVEIRAPAKNKVVNEVFTITGDQMIKTYKINNVEAKRYYKKEPKESRMVY